MKVKGLKYAIPVNAIFLASILYLAYSSLTISKAITIQSQSTAIFMRSLREKDVLFAIFDSVAYILIEAVLPLLPFLFLTGLGFLILLVFRERIDAKILLSTQPVFLVLTFLLTNFSIVMLLAYIGCSVGSALAKGITPSGKFSAGRVFTSKGLRWINVFLAIGLFLSLYFNLQSYQQEMVQTTFDLIESFLPLERLQEAQKQQASSLINQTSEGLKSSIRQQYNQVDPQAREQCKPVYDAIVLGIDNYKQEANQRLQVEIGEEEVRNYTAQFAPIFEQGTKAAPLIFAVLFFSLLEILRPFISVAFGAIYSLVLRVT